MALQSPNPIALTVGDFEIRWYGICFAGGIALVWLVMRLLANGRDWTIPPDHVDGVMVWNTVALLVGGRFFEMLFYRTCQWLADPWSIVDIDRGGMSFFGGLFGVIVSTATYARANGLSALHLFDLTAVATPLGLGLGRIGNWVNGEFLGPVTGLPWGTIGPEDGAPRHPVALYESLGEGLLLFLVLLILARLFALQRVYGALSALFLIGYGVIRFFLEPLRPDAIPIGPLQLSVSQYFCLTTIVFGIALIVSIRKSLHSDQK